MNTTMESGGFNNFGNAPGTEKTEEKNQTIVPLVIEQIVESTGDTFKLWCIEANIIKIVGMVKNIEHSSTKITYTVEDHTGEIDCYLWLEEGDNTEVTNIMMNTYVEVFGNVRKNQSNKSLMVFKIDSVKTFNQVTTHLLEVLQARYLSEKWQNDGGFNTTINPSAGTTLGLGNSSISGMNSIGLNQQQQSIYNVIRSYPYPEGISVKLLLEKFPALNTNELSKITEFLCNEGHIYTSIDSEHFLSTDM